MAHLGELPLGARARVRAIACERPVRRRLLELGVLPGTELEIVRRAPLGDPIELSLRGYRLSLRAEEARTIEVEALSATANEPAAAPARA
ncbi:MAG: ferrous iron transport protein A [Myxococcales bacterium]|nr:ferrous iron transport protein A [Myxococcales bacterium]